MPPNPRSIASAAFRIPSGGRQLTAFPRICQGGPEAGAHTLRTREPRSFLPEVRVLVARLLTGACQAMSAKQCVPGRSAKTSFNGAKQGHRSFTTPCIA